MEPQNQLQQSNLSELCNFSTNNASTDLNDAKQLDCGTGKRCFVKDAIDPTFKLHYRGQMIKLIRKIIAAACDPNYDCTGDTKRETNLKNEMKIVRSVKYPWPDLTSMFLTSRESVCIITRKILDVMSECEDEMEVLYLCTSVTDQCVLLAAKKLRFYDV